MTSNFAIRVYFKDCIFTETVLRPGKSILLFSSVPDAHLKKVEKETSQLSSFSLKLVIPKGLGHPEGVSLVYNWDAPADGQVGQEVG